MTTARKTDLEELAIFFGLPMNDPQIAALLGVSADDLTAFIAGGSPLATPDPGHLADLAAFARETTTYLFADPDWTPERQAAMRSWLDEARIEIEGTPRSPRAILGDARLTKLALSELLLSTE